MHRRRYLALASGAIALAGCSDTSGESADGEAGGGNGGKQDYLPVTPNGDGDYLPGEVRYDLEHDAENPEITIDVSSLSIEGQTMSLVYADPTGNRTTLFETVAYVAFVYAKFVDLGTETTDRLEVTVTDGSDDERFSYHAEAGWAEQYTAGEVSKGAYACKVAETGPLSPVGC